MPQVQIDPRFHGPPHSANGGYVCGTLADIAERPVAVSLRLPPPLGRTMSVEVGDDGTVRLRDGETLVAEAEPTDVAPMVPPAAVSVAQARVASQRFVGFDEHPFPTCWTCGPRRAEGDGLHIFPGAVAGPGSESGLVAAAWTPGADLDDGSGHVRGEQVWAALDCPSNFGAVTGRPAVLARMSADLAVPVPVGRPNVVLGWTAGAPEGRKRHGASAIVDADGAVLASAAALWITLSPEELAAVLGTA